MSKPNVFISYSLHDEDWVKAFARSLMKHDLGVWYDLSADKAGDQWLKELQKAIKKSSIVVFLITPEALGTNYQLFEIGAAFGVGKPIVSIVPEGMERSRLPGLFRSHTILRKEKPEVTAEHLMKQVAVLDN